MFRTQLYLARKEKVGLAMGLELEREKQTLLRTRLQMLHQQHQPQHRAGTLGGAEQRL